MSSYRVMIIDDAEDVHEVVGTYLELSGYEVVHAYNGRAGLDAMLSGVPDLVLLDIQMPVLDGFGALEELRSQPRLADVPVLVLSSLDRPNLKVKALQIGADDYIVKPFDSAELMARVGRALRRSDRYRRLSSTMSGQLADIGLAELLQTIEIGRKTAIVRLHDLEAEIVMVGGDFAAAEWRGFAGQEALTRVLLLEQGRFEVDFDARPEADQESRIGLQDALMAAIVRLDEVQQAADDSLSWSSVVESGAQATGVDTPAGLASALPCTVAEAAAAMPGDLEDNLNLLTDYLDRGVIRVQKEKE